MTNPQPHDLLLSVCVCTHNARRDYFVRVLEALKAQTLPSSQWELILVDNQSAEPIADWINLTGFEHVAVLGEEQLGLTHARLRAIRQARAPLIVFVDDDNLLQNDYLQQAQELFTSKPFLGIVGGKCLGRYEVKVPHWVNRFLPYMAVADHGGHAIWAHHRGTYQPWFPYGAGMVLRREIALEYARQLECDPDRKRYGRKGTMLTSSEDIDMVFTAIDCGYAVGYFPQLSLLHLIPPQRLRLRYLSRLVFHAHRSTYHLMMERRIHQRPRHWPVAYFAAILQCILANEWHPLTWYLSLQVAHGRYVAHRQYRRSKRDRDRQRAELAAAHERATQQERTAALAAQPAASKPKAEIQG